jgi:hypothetical protein
VEEGFQKKKKKKSGLQAFRQAGRKIKSKDILTSKSQSICKSLTERHTPSKKIEAVVVDKIVDHPKRRFRKCLPKRIIECYASVSS